LHSPPTFIHHPPPLAAVDLDPAADLYLFSLHSLFSGNIGRCFLVKIGVNGGIVFVPLNTKSP
ncbi:hypothetical protein, partial [Proteus mirabilis]|uniref:hypothetical protein n=1 Tax=Proteus mirabilis TaxID=584 RepID=UPI001C12E329